MSQEIKLSILLLSHNVEQYISKALDSILEQKVDFNYEILVGDDCATDNTVSIIKEYQKIHPDKIKMHLTEVNRGNAFNFANLHRVSKGQYITVLDGDDYWIDNNKLQKQIDFLDSNLNFAVCGHNSYLLYENKDNMEAICGVDEANYSFICNDFRDLLLGGQCPYMHTSSLIYRKFKEGDVNFEKWKDKYYRGDLIRTLFYGAKGKVKYLNEIMSVYRIHERGIFTKMSKLDQEVGHIEFYLYHRKNTFGNKYKDEFYEIIDRQYKELLEPSNDHFFTKKKYLFLRKHIRLDKINSDNKSMYNQIMSQVNLLLFCLMSIFIKYKKQQ